MERILQAQALVHSVEKARRKGIAGPRGSLDEARGQLKRSLRDHRPLLPHRDHALFTVDHRDGLWGLFFEKQGGLAKGRKTRSDEIPIENPSRFNFIGNEVVDLPKRALGKLGKFGMGVTDQIHGGRQAPRTRHLKDLRCP